MNSKNRLYEGTVQEFKEDVNTNRIADMIAKAFEQYYKRKVNKSEYRSWDYSLRVLKDVLEKSKLAKNKIVVEYQLPYSEKRIDILLFGEETEGLGSIVLIELKQWSNDSVKDSEHEGNVFVDFGRFKKEQAHPSLQAEGYYWHLKDFMSVFEEQPQISLSACVYCHNYNKGSNEPLFLPKFDKVTKNYPLFSKEDFMELGDYLKTKLSFGDGLEVLGRFNTSLLRPSKRLLEHTRDMINKQQIFNLIEDQITAYNAIMSRAKKLAASKEKAIIIVKGGPGTGKSVIALEVMGELLRKGKKVYHATGSSAFTKTLRQILGSRSSSLFKFFNSFMAHKEDEIDVLICDEAHRIRKTSESMYTPASLRTGKPQIEELISASRLSIFFIDEHQVVRPTEIGSIELIKRAGKNLGVVEKNILEYELTTQFRCSGSDSYLQWVESTLGIKESEHNQLTSEDKMHFEIVENPHKLKAIIDNKNKEKKNSARIVAGFCWPWSQPRADGSLVNDVKIGDFEMPWEKKDDFWKWAIDDSGMNQVGTVYTSQGFEFDYIGIIFGNDIVYDPEKKGWKAILDNSKDSMMKRGNEKFAEHLKNVYRVLLSRAHKGVYIYFMDKNTEEYFKSKILK